MDFDKECGYSTIQTRRTQTLVSSEGLWPNNAFSALRLSPRWSDRRPRRPHLEQRQNEITEYFDCEHLPEDLQPVSAEVGEAARYMDETPPNCAKKSIGLRKLLEMKDCLVRAALRKRRAGNHKKPELTNHPTPKRGDHHGF